MTKFKKILQDSKDNKKFIGIRNYDYDDKLLCGFIKDFNDNLVLVQHFTEYGEMDGLILVRMEDIEILESNDDYCLAIQFLAEYKNNINEIYKNIDLSNLENWQFDFLNKFKNTDKIIAIEFEGDYTIYGIIEDLDVKFITLKTVGQIGDLDGFSTYRLSNIKALMIDNFESLNRKILLDWNLKNTIKE